MSAISTTFARPMSIAPASIPAGRVEVVCSQCECISAIPTHLSHEVFVCSTCRRGERLRDCATAKAILHDLIHGTGEFDCLSQAERQEQLDGFGLGSRQTPRALPNKESTVFVPSDEPIYTWDGEEPDAATREWIESRAEADDAKCDPDAFDSQFGAQDDRAMAFD